MTLRKLDPNPRARLSEKFPNHPLLMTCQKVFHHYMACMDSFDFTSEDLFAEAANVLDEIFNAPTAAPDYLNDLWDSLKIKLKRKAQATPPQDDLEKVCGVLFFVVAATLALHWRQYYKETLVHQLRSIVDRHGAFSDIGEQENIINNLCVHAESLGEWVNQYEESGEWLSDEISTALSRKPRKPLQKDNPADGKSPGAETYSRYSFKLNLPRKYQGKDHEVLDWLYNELIQNHFIEKVKGIQLNKDLSQITDSDTQNRLVFNTVFSGADTDYHIIWTGNKVELRYFIRQLRDRKVLDWKKGPKIWQITRNRIWFKETIYVHNESTGRNEKTYKYVQFGEQDLAKGNKPKDTTILDKIIDVLSPPEGMKKSDAIGAEIEEEFEGYANHDMEAENAWGRILPQGYRETSHKSKYGD